MAEELYMHSSSVSTQEDTSSLPVPETKFEGSEGERFRWSEKWQMLFNFRNVNVYTQRREIRA